MRKSGARPAVKRSKFCWRDVAPCGIRPHRGDAILKIRRRFPDRGRGHQRMAGGAVLAAPRGAGGPPSGPGVACGAGPDFRPEKMLPKKFETPLPEDWAWDGPGRPLEHNSAAAIRIAPVRLLIARSIRPMPCPSVASNPVSEGPVTVSNSLTEGILLSRPARARGGETTHHTSAFVPGCKPAINVQSKHFPHFHSSISRPPTSHENP